MKAKLLGALIGVARAMDSSAAPPTREDEDALCEALNALRAPQNADVAAHLEQLHAVKARLVPDCMTCTHPCGRNADCDAAAIFAPQTESQHLKAEILAQLTTAPFDPERSPEKMPVLRGVLLDLGERSPPPSCKRPSRAQKRCNEQSITARFPIGEALPFLFIS